MSDYAIPYQRKSKRDLNRKRKNRVYKRGGKFRTVKLEGSNQQEEKQENN